jgi:hypothetical protein
VALLSCRTNTDDLPGAATALPLPLHRIFPAPYSTPHKLTIFSGRLPETKIITGHFLSILPAPLKSPVSISRIHFAKKLIFGSPGKKILCSLLTGYKIACMQNAPMMITKIIKGFTSSFFQKRTSNDTLAFQREAHALRYVLWV